MPVIEHPNTCHTIIVTVDADPDVLPTLEAHARAGLTLFQEFDGFIGGALHRSTDGGRMIQYTQWTTKDLYERCLNDPRWESLESAVTFLELVESGEARMDVRAFEVIAAVDASAS